MKPPPILQVLIAVSIAWLLARFLPVWHFDGSLTIVLIWIFGILGSVFLVLALGIFRTHKTTVDPLNPAKAKHLVVTGVYRITRNPMYVSMAFLLTAWCFYLGDLISFLVLPMFVVAINELQIKGEESALSHNFGDEYEAYRERVRRWL